MKILTKQDIKIRENSRKKGVPLGKSGLPKEIEFRLTIPEEVRDSLKREKRSYNLIAREALLTYYQKREEERQHAAADNEVRSWDLVDFEKKVIKIRHPTLLFGSSGEGKSTTVQLWIQKIIRTQANHNKSLVVIDIKGHDFDFAPQDPKRQEILKKVHGTNNLPVLETITLRQLRDYENPEVKKFPRFTRVILGDARREAERGVDAADLINQLDFMKEVFLKQDYEVVLIVDEAYRLTQFAEFSPANPYRRASVEGFAATIREFVSKALFIGQEPFLKNTFKCVRMID